MRFSFKKIIALNSLLLFVVLGVSGCQSGEEVVAKLSAKAEKGDVDAMVELGEMYCGAKSVEQDDQICAVWIKRAAESGHKRAQYMLGRIYEAGIGVRSDYAQAYRWYMVSNSQTYHMAGDAAKELEKRMNSLQLEQAKKMAAETIAEMNAKTQVKK